ncbi:MAG: ATP phosphoribosyltransferase [Planctomycetota bacterium]|nr:ATP phosphoribosyltransferase [Planctomycetota bacterium]
MTLVRFAIPKGSMEDATFRFLEEAWSNVHGRSRTYRISLGDPEIGLKLLRPQEIPTFVHEGMYDVGIAGKDWIEETRADVERLLDLEYARVKLILAAPKSGPYRSLAEMVRWFAKKRRPLRISTEYLSLSAAYVMRCAEYRRRYGTRKPVTITPWWRTGKNGRVRLLLSFGATEAKPPEDADAIIDNTETGTTLAQNNLRVLDTIMESSALLIANKDALADREKRQKIFDILSLLKGVVDGRKSLHIFVNVREDRLAELLSGLPALKRPTVSPLSEKGWFSINTIICKNEFVRVLPTLRRLAQGLVVHEPRQILPLEEIKQDEEQSPLPLGEG